MKFTKITIIILIIACLFIPFAQVKAANLIFENIEVIKSIDNSIIIKWQTNKSTRGTIRFGINSQELGYYIAESSGSSLSRWHETTISNLRADSIYYYQIEASDGAETIKSFVRDFDTDDYNIQLGTPKISNLEIVYISATAVGVRWNTDLSTTSYIEYGESIDAMKKVKVAKNTTKHLAVIKKLKPDTKYFIKVYAYNKDNIKSADNHDSFTTRRQGSKNEGDLIFYDFRPLSSSDPLITPHSINIVFETNNLAYGYITVTAQGTRKQKYKLEYDTKHNLLLQELIAGKCYDFSLGFKDIFGNKQNETKKFCTLEETGTVYHSESGETIYTEYNLSENSTNESGIGGSDEILVLGEEYSYFTPASALLKTSDSPKIFAIQAEQRHEVSSPEAFNDYGYSWNDIRTVSWPEIAKYPEARLVKAADTDRIYFLWKNSTGKRAKINILSPTVFNSYPDNRWENVIKISAFDIESYEDVKLVKTKGSIDTYYLSEGKKYFISQALFYERGFNTADVLTISQTHLDAIANGGNL